MTAYKELYPKLLIVGAGDLGQAIAEQVIAAGLYQQVAFLDDHPDDEKQQQAPIIGRIQDIELFHSEFTHAIAAIGNNQTRQTVRDYIKAAGYIEPTIIHPSAVISPTATVGAGSIIREQVVLSRKVQIGEGVLLNIGVSIDHNCIIGDNTHIPMGAIFRNNVNIAALSVFQPGAVIE